MMHTTKRASALMYFKMHTARRATAFLDHTMHKTKRATAVMNHNKDTTKRATAVLKHKCTQPSGPSLSVTCFQTYNSVEKHSKSIAANPPQSALTACTAPRTTPCSSRLCCRSGPHLGGLGVHAIAQRAASCLVAKLLRASISHTKMMKRLLVAWSLIPTSASEIMLVPRLAWSLIPTSASETQSMHRLLLASALVSTLASETKQAPWTMMRSIPAIPTM